MNFDVRCDRCGETGTINRMDIKAGVCIYCRSEAETSAPPTEPSELDTLRAQNADLLAALERLVSKPAPFCETIAGAVCPNSWRRWSG